MAVAADRSTAKDELFSREVSVVSSKAVQDEMIAYLPNVRAFAISLCGDVDRADDLVQETLLKAWRHLDTFTEGTNLRAWMFTILRHVFISELRRRRMTTLSLDADPAVAHQVGVRPEQHGWMDGKDMQRALAMLNPSQREAIILVGAEGFTYEEAAGVCNCPVGTIKSRVNRARIRLAELLDITLPDLAAGDSATAAVQPAATPLPVRPALASDATPADAPAKPAPSRRDHETGREQAAA
jgi:RNA polymerase sigma-70 factor (ECF subfamily)